MPKRTRIVVATRGLWTAGKLASSIGTLDRLVSRMAAVSVLRETLWRYEAQLANWRAFGLIGRAPRDWGDAEPGTEALVRNDFLDFVHALRQQGIGVEVTELGWNLTFSINDLADLISPSRRLEVEFLTQASPGLLSFLIEGPKGTSKFSDVLIHVFNHLFHFGAMRRLMKAAADFAEAQVDAAQMDALQRGHEERRRRVEVDLEIRRLLASPSGAADSEQSLVQVDYEAKLHEQRTDLIQGGARPNDVARVLTEPTNRDLDALTRFKCEGLIAGIGAEDLPDDAE